MNDNVKKTITDAKDLTALVAIGFTLVIAVKGMKDLAKDVWDALPSMEDVEEQ